MSATHIPHDPKNPDWWMQEARTKRTFAREYGRSVDSIRILLREAEDCERSAAKLRCRAEWDNVNDPPCHPGDKAWAPCATCAA